MSLYALARQITEDVFGPSAMEVGKIVKHPRGYKVRIISGQYWGLHGLSNFWEWKRVLKNGKLSKKIERGYGWHKEDL